MEADATEARLDGLLAKLQADPELNLMVPFPALGWRVTLMSGGEPEMFRARVYTGPECTLTVDHVHSGDEVRRLLRKTAAADNRRAALLGRLLALQAEAFLKAAAGE